jgi:hypothetical protein
LSRPLIARIANIISFAEPSHDWARLGVDAIEMSYPKEDERERHDSHEDLKTLADPAWLNRYKITCQTTAQEEVVNSWCRLLTQNSKSRNMAFNGWTILLPLSDIDCGTLQIGLMSGEIVVED